MLAAQEAHLAGGHARGPLVDEPVVAVEGEVAREVGAGEHVGGVVRVPGAAVVGGVAVAAHEVVEGGEALLGEEHVRLGDGGAAVQRVVEVHVELYAEQREEVDICVGPDGGVFEQGGALAGGRALHCDPEFHDGLGGAGGDAVPVEGEHGEDAADDVGAPEDEAGPAEGGHVAGEVGAVVHGAEHGV